MKRIALFAGFFFLEFLGLCQGTVNFANGSAGVNAPCYCGGVGPDAGLSVANGPWSAMLYAGPAGTPENALTSTIVSGMPVSVGTSAAGYFFGGARTISGVPSGSEAALQVRVWRADLGSTWESAAAMNSYYTGKSLPITVTLGGGATPTPNMVGLTSFVLCIPEPSVMTVGLLGLVVVGLRFVGKGGRRV